MRILERYITDTMIKIFLGCIIASIFLYVIIDIFSHLDELLKHKTNILILKDYYLSYLPVIFVQIAPVACLLATLYTLGSLTRNNEIIAMRTSGLSILQITQTMIMFGIIISVFVFLVNEKITPVSLNQLEQVKTKMKEEPTQDKQKETIKNLSIYGLNNRLIFVSKFIVKDNTMEGITILEQDENQNVTKKIVANKGIWENGLWKFYQSLTYNFDISGQMKGDPQYLEEEIMNIIETPQDFLNQRQRPETMNISQLEDYIMRLSHSGAETIVKNLRVDLYHKFTFPFTSLVIIIVGIPFALRIKGRVTALSSLGISFMVGFLYYVSNAICLALGKANFLPPLVAASLGHILFLFLGIYLIFNLY